MTGYGMTCETSYERVCNHPHAVCCATHRRERTREGTSRPRKTAVSHTVQDIAWSQNTKQRSASALSPVPAKFKDKREQPAGLQLRSCKIMSTHHEHQQEGEQLQQKQDTSPPKHGQFIDGDGLEEPEDKTGGDDRRRPSRLRQGRRRSSSSKEPYRGLRRGVSAAMLKEGTSMPSPGLFDSGPQTPDYQQSSSQEQRNASDVTIPPEAHCIRDWHVERETVVAETCDRLGIGSGSKAEFFEQPRMVGLAGPCGSGKSTVASMVVAREDVRKHFYKGVLWLPVGQGAKDRLSEVTLSLAKMVYETVMLRACRPPRISGVGVTPEDGAAYIHEVVKESDLRFLVVADNVWEPEVLKELKWAGVWVLYTTRYDNLVSVAPLRLDRVLKKEAEEVLRRAAEIGEDAPLPGAAYELMQRCELSVMHLAFAGRWRVVRGRSEEEAWRAALDHIGEAQKGGEGGQLLPWRAAMLRAGPGELVSDAPQNRELYLSLAILPKGLAFCSTAAAVLLYGDDCSDEELGATEEVLSVLERLSILTMEVGGKYRVHEVHADFVSDCVATDARNRALLRWKAHISTVKALNTYSSSWLAKMWNVVEEMEGKGAIARPYDAALDAMEPLSVELSTALRRAARFHWQRKDHLEAYTKQHQLYLLEESRIDGNSVAAAKVLHILGMCVNKGGRKEQAEDFYRRALAIFEAKLGPDDLEVAHTLYELGRCCYAAGRTREAEECLRRALTIEEDKLGAHHLDVASTMYHLGVCLYRAERREEAKELLRPALAIWEEHPGGERLNVAHALHSLGLCALKTGQEKEAEELLSQSLHIREEVLGSGTADVASSLHYLGACAAKAGRAEDAEKLYRQALAIREEKLEANHPDLALTLHNLGICLHRAGQTENAEGLLRRALSIKEAELGDDHPSVNKTRQAIKSCSPATDPARFALPVLLAGGVLGVVLLLRSVRRGRV
ncbi:unnamed protein product [Pylaiella littoralis]